MEKLSLSIEEGWLVKQCAERQISPHFDSRETNDISLLVIHNISLPPNQFGGPYITDLFLGKLNPKEHPYFEDIYQLRVSAHCLIRRDGRIVQYVPFDKRAWHAGVSSYKGKEKCNDYSIGIEMEGADDVPYTQQQYDCLAELTCAIKKAYPNIAENIVGHNHIAPGRKTDPGEAFDWSYYFSMITKR